MRYAYAVIADADADILSSCLPDSLSFTNYIDIDKYFIDTGDSRRQCRALLRTVGRNDQVVISSKDTCGLSEEEFNEFEDLLWEKKARLTCAIEATVPLASIDLMKKEVNEDKSQKHRRKLRVDVDPVLFATLYKEWEAGKINKGEMAHKTGLSYAGLTNRLERYEQLGE